MNEKLALYCGSPESSLLLFNLRLEFRALLGQNIPAVPHEYLSLSLLAKSMSTDKKNFATDLKQGRIHRTDDHTKILHRILKFE